MSAPDDLEHLLENQMRIWALTLRPSSIKGYRGTARRFLRYLRSTFPLVREPSDLRRDPHSLGWFTSLRAQQPPLSNRMCWLRLLLLRRLLQDLAAQGHPLPLDLIRTEDFPTVPRWLPRALSVEDDQKLRAYLCDQQDLLSHALLLTRLTGMRIGECINLSRDCLRQIADDQWALHIPLGKLHTERLVPADDQIREIVGRMAKLACECSATPGPSDQRFLLPHYGKATGLYGSLRLALADAARNANCSCKVTPHQLRHTYATELIRLGVSLPAVALLLGHKDIRMTMRYIQVTQVDLQREFHAARRNAENVYKMPVLTVPGPATIAGPAGILQALTSVLHLIEMYRRQIHEPKVHDKIKRLKWRLLGIRADVNELRGRDK